MISTSQKIIIAYTLLLINIGIVCLLFFRFTAEDAYIVSRYAVNLVDHGVLHFNPGESISALTSPLHALLLSLFYATTSQTVSGFKIVAIALLLASIIAVIVTIKPQQSIFVVAMFSYSGVLLWTFGGLETPILLFCMTILALLTYKEAWRSINGVIAIGLLAGLCFLTRYDTVVFTGPLLLTIIFKMKTVSKRLLIAAIPSLVSLSWLIFSYAYFGDIFPTSLYLKTPSASISGFIYLLTNLSKTGISLSIAILVTFYLLSKYRDIGRTISILSIIQTLLISVCFVAIKSIAFLIDWLLLIPYLYLINAALLIGYRMIRDDQFRQEVRLEFKRGIQATIWILPSLLLLMAYAFTSATKHMMFNTRLLVPYLPAMALAVLVFFQTIHREKTKDNFQQCVLVLSFLLIFLNFAHSMYTYFYSVNGIGNIGHEYQYESAANYAQSFMPTLADNAQDIKAHWESLGNTNEVPRIATFAAGILPDILINYYIYSDLISLRANCEPPTLAISSHYIHTFSPQLGSLEWQLGTLSIDNLELISSHELMFNGEVGTLAVYYNPSPHKHMLPATLRGECETTDNRTILIRD